MVIKDVLEQLGTANHPVAKQLHKGDNFKVIIIGFKGGMKLKEHTAPLPSKYDEIEIPVNIFHFVIAKENSLCTLTQG